MIPTLVCTPIQYPLLFKVNLNKDSNYRDNNREAARSKQFNWFREEARLRSALSPGFSQLLCHHYARHDGGQHRACYQLLASFREIQITGARRVCRPQSLDPVFALFRLFRRNGRPL